MDHIPVVLLKTQNTSTATDAYAEHFSNLEVPQQGGGRRFRPIFVPVLEHTVNETNITRLRRIIESQACNARSRPGEPNERVEGFIFTSQRAVEAFARTVEDIRRHGGSIDDFLTDACALYVVGPATARGLRALNLKCPILGEETGNGEALAKFILEHHHRFSNAAQEQEEPRKKSKLLFLVGEQRRDIIPRTLTAKSLGERQRIDVEELEIYKTQLMASFSEAFDSVLETITRSGNQRRWIVVFSPTGCKPMLERLGLSKEATAQWERERKGPGTLGDFLGRSRRTFIATIGPTTRDYLLKEFGLEPDVCAEKPNEEALGRGILECMQTERFMWDPDEV